MKVIGENEVRIQLKESTGPAGPAGADGKDGTSVTHSWRGTTLTVTSASGTSSADLKGEKGEPGKDGKDGATGLVGPAGADGKDGAPGADGEDGGYYSPSVDAEGNLTWMPSKTGMPGVAGANIRGPEGPKGEAGQDGATGPEGKQGATGPSGADGEDGGYYTPAVDNDGNLTWTASKADMPDVPGVNIKGPAGSIDNMPIASATQLGGVMPVAKTDDMTQAVGVDDAGRLWTAPGGSSEGYAIDTLLDVTVEEEVQYIYQALDGNHTYSQIRVWAEIKPSSQNSGELELHIKLNSTEESLWSGAHVGTMQSICKASTDYWGDLIVFLGPGKGEAIYGRYNNQQNNSSNMNYHYLYRTCGWNVSNPVNSIRVDVGNWNGWLGVGSHILIQGVRA